MFLQHGDNIYMTDIGKSNMGRPQNGILKLIHREMFRVTSKFCVRIYDLGTDFCIV
jgi:hypothetical protein